jgi:tRNA pseudouridine55 synthase
VNRIQRKIRPTKTGHAGTLDPLATGVLVLCVGPATRLIQYVQQLPKLYLATFLLGCHSDTDDIDGQVEQIAAPPIPTRQQVEELLPQFVGEIQQRPPAYSAVKVRGQRAYQRARRGESVELMPRPVRVFDITVQQYTYPQLKLQIHCGSGTYVRSIGRDLGELLGTAAVMSDLQRAAIGNFRVEDALDPEELATSEVSRLLLPATEAVTRLAKAQVTDREKTRLSQGLAIDRPSHGHQAAVAALDGHQRLVAILLPKGRDALRPAQNFPFQQE